MKTGQLFLEENPEKLLAEIHELQLAYDRLFDEAEAGFKIRDARIAALEGLVKAVDVNGDIKGYEWFKIRDSGM